MLVFACLLAAPVRAQVAPDPVRLPAAAVLDSAKGQLDDVELVLRQGRVSTDELTDLRTTISAVRDSIAKSLTELEPRVVESQTRLKQLGPAPASSAPPESPAIAAERIQLNELFSGLDGAVKQAKLLQTRADQLAQQIADRRQAIFANRLFRRDPSALDPKFWAEVARLAPHQTLVVCELPRAFVQAARAAGPVRVTAVAALFIILAVGIASFARLWRRRFRYDPQTGSRLTKAVAGLWVFITFALRAPLIALACVKLLDVAGLLPAPLGSLGLRFVVAVAVASIGRGLALGLLAPQRPARRLAPFDDATAQLLQWHLVWAGRALGLAVFMDGLNKATAAPPELATAVSIVFAAIVAGLIVSLLFGLSRVEQEEAAGGGRALIRPLSWLFAGVVVGALLVGYVRFAAFLSGRGLATVAVVGTAYLLIHAIDALLTDAIGGETARGRAIARNIGVSTRNVGLVATVLSGVIRALLVLLALFLVIGPWEVTTAELSGALENVSLQFSVGEITISFRAILAAALVFVVTLFVTRIVQRWLQERLLPHTAIEPSLQLSIATIFGYLGAILAVMLALGGLGIDLQKIALVAGALSVGIGFGLQSIVSNFVSGLILLAERPIRVGDAIVVKGEEGWVRRIRVRATEIETYDRASVIVPNSELITGVVKNFTHFNTMGRIGLKISVAYDSDPERMRGILLGVANAHPQVLKAPPASVYLVNFGDSALDFELRCVVNNVQNSLTVRSELSFAVLKEMRAAGVAMPVWQREERTRREERERQAAAEAGAAQSPPEAAAPQSPPAPA
jgi:small-conductance mechanosensitive channel